MATIKDYQKLDIRVGKIVDVEMLPEPKHATHKIFVDFGKEIGKKISVGRFVNYTKDDLIGKLILGVVNLEPKQIGKNISEILLLGAPDSKRECILAIPEKDVEIGVKIY